MRSDVHVVVFTGVFIARGKEDVLVTKNLVPGEVVYGEKKIVVEVGVVLIVCLTGFVVEVGVVLIVCLTGFVVEVGVVLIVCLTGFVVEVGVVLIVCPYLPTIPDSPDLLRKSASNYGITARGKIITDILYYGNLVTLGNNR